MDFFANQDAARRKTKYLVFVFLLAVFVITCLANVVVVCSLWLFGSTSLNHSSPLGTYFSWRIFGWVCFGVNAIIFLAILYKWLKLSDGGKSVAESLGGRRILPNTTNLLEKRALNVVEEMALASGMPVPPVYLLEGEKGINAFAAGNTPADAVIGITKGSLDNFNREQLQGVVAHEFSHILNGDMRLNLRLIALLNGILFLGHCGRIILRSTGFSSRSSKRSGGGRILILGLGLVAIGMIGTFFGGLIKAAINRQREFLADASAVQFTRDPGGIGSALKIIGGFAAGSRLLSASSEEASHLFISNALSGFAFFKTHPPLEERIRLLDPDWDGKMIKPAAVHEPQKDTTEEQKKRAMASSAAMLGVILTKEDLPNSNASQPEEEMPTVLLDKLRDPLSASAALYALLLDDDPLVRDTQLSYLKEQAASGVDTISLNLAEELAGMDPSFRIIVIEQCMPALKCMSQPQYVTFIKMLKKLIQADKHIDLFEWCLYQMVIHYLGGEFAEHPPSRPIHKTVAAVKQHYGTVLSTVIHNCHLDPATAQRAFSRGATTAGLYNSTLIPRQSCTMKEFMNGVKAMSDCYPLLKGRLIKGLVNVIEFDRKITPLERELITAIAAVMDSPVPRLGQFSP